MDGRTVWQLRACSPWNDSWCVAAEDERDSRGQPEPEPESGWRSWVTRDDVATIAIALGISYGIRWCVVPLTDVHRGHSCRMGNVAAMRAVMIGLLQCIFSSTNSGLFCRPPCE